MVQRPVQRSRLDLHNRTTDLGAASAGACGFTHLPSGRVCWLPHRHLGSCQFESGAPGNVDRRPSARVSRAERPR
jgi:hypothetical protein